MGEKPESTGWWQTLPGILTATAGILTAIGCLIVAFHQAGFLRHDSQTAPQVQNEMVKPSRTPEYPDTAPCATKPQSKIRAVLSCNPGGELPGKSRRCCLQDFGRAA